MSRPQRIQLSRKRGWRMPENTVRVCRPGPWGNPFKVSRHEDDNGKCWVVSGDAVKLWFFPTKRDAWQCAVDRFRERCRSINNQFAIRHHLRGKNLACWCRPGEPCHADVLLEIAND